MAARAPSKVGCYSSPATVQLWLQNKNLQNFNSTLGQLDGSFLVYLAQLEDMEARQRFLGNLGIDRELHLQLIEALQEACADLVGARNEVPMHMSMALVLARLEARDPKLLSIDLQLRALKTDDLRLVDLFQKLVLNRTVATLSLAKNELRDPGCDSLRLCLTTNHTLTHLNLSSNEIRDRGCKSLAKGLEGGCTLTHLDMSFNIIRDQGCLALCCALVRSSHLRFLSLAHNHIKGPACQGVALCLQTNPNLIHLDLSGNGIFLVGLARLMSTDGLRANPLQTLNLRNNSLHLSPAQWSPLDPNKWPLGPVTPAKPAESGPLPFIASLSPPPTPTATTATAVSEEAAEPVCELPDSNIDDHTEATSPHTEPADNSTVDQNLHLPDPTEAFVDEEDGEDGSPAALLTPVQPNTRKRVREEDEEDKSELLVAKALESNTNVTHLDLSQAITSHFAWPVVLLGLRCNEAIMHLDLSFTPLKTASASALGTALASNRTLRAIKVSGCRLKAKGIAQIAQGMRSNTTLTELHVDRNHARLAGAQLLAEMLRANTSLTSLNTAFNELEDAGVLVMIDALCENRTMCEVNLAANGVTAPTHAEALAKLAQHNNGLIKVDMFPFERSVHYARREFWSKNVCLDDILARNRRVRRSWRCLAPWISFARSNGSDHPLLNSFHALLTQILAFSGENTENIDTPAPPQPLDDVNMSAFMAQS